MTAVEATNELAHLILRVNTGGVSYDEGKVLALPLLRVINNKQAEIAKKFGRRPSPISYGYALRTGMGL